MVVAAQRAEPNPITERDDLDAHVAEPPSSVAAAAWQEAMSMCEFNVTSLPERVPLAHFSLEVRLSNVVAESSRLW